MKGYYSHPMFSSIAGLGIVDHKTNGVYAIFAGASEYPYQTLAF